jgi:hypothetical protein
MSNDTNYQVVIKGGSDVIDRLLNFLEEKKTRYEAWQKITQGLSPQERQESLTAALKEHGLNNYSDFVTWGFNLEERQDFKKNMSGIALSAWANENSQNCSISGEEGELAGLYRKFPNLEFRGALYSDEYSEGICLPPNFEKQESVRSATTLKDIAMSFLEEGGEQMLKEYFDMGTKDYRYLDRSDNIAERLIKLEGEIDLTGLVELSVNDAKIIAKSTRVILSRKMEKVVACYRGKKQERKK